MNVTKEAMFKLVNHFASGVNGMFRDNYFAMAKNVDDCEFKFKRKRTVKRAVLRFKGVEIYPNDCGGVDEEENPWTTIAVLICKRWKDDYDGCFRYSLLVKDTEYMKFEPSEKLLIDCGIEI